ncbi:VOC family protein [Litoreibacter janthinus]|uniref:Catechol 2,3-dioxygenase n=1 Tax=Litoreibacter janthinus TaxID=670154 RepID=A0A1I6FU44_9RHOB|nr:VOC family protein [Litoreibacter janthinus]SFR33441.1 Catechol 2,3-dioxygenase [Litoreibacter janthinus]
MTPKLSGLDHLVLTVADIPTSAAFYQDVLGMDVQQFQPADGSARTALSFGRQKINLHQAGAEFRPHGRAPTPGSADLCFLTEAPLDEWALHLDLQGVGIEEGPVMRSGATGPIRSLYIRDPDGNLIEISVSMARNA